MIVAQQLEINLVAMVEDWYWDGGVAGIAAFVKYFPDARPHMCLQHACIMIASTS